MSAFVNAFYETLYQHLVPLSAHFAKDLCDMQTALIEALI